MGKELGFIDMQLNASAILTNVSLWTLDKKLKEVFLKPGLDTDDREEISIAST